MKRIIPVLILLVILTYGCSKGSASNYYIEPIEFSTSEMKMIELSKMKDHMLYLDYRVPEKYKALTFWFETYQDNQLINDAGILYGLGENDHKGTLVIQIADEDLFKIQVKQLNHSESGHSLSSFSIENIDAVKESRGKSASYIEEGVELNDETEIVLAAYTYDIGKGMLSSSIQEFQNNDDRVLKQSLYVLFKLKLLEDF